MDMNDTRDDGKWGAAIDIGGVKPDWLQSDVQYLVKDWRGNWFPEPETANNSGWRVIAAIRLPADHPHYRQAPSIDWTAPIEAVHEDGNVRPVTLRRDCSDRPADKQPMLVSPTLPDSAEWFGTDGGHPWSNWRIRNTTQTTRTTDEQLTHYAERCKALVERMAAMNPISEVAMMHTSEFDEARAIVASMVEVDPFEEAMTILDVYLAAYPKADDKEPVDREGGDDLLTFGHLRAILNHGRGRALERGE